MEAGRILDHENGFDFTKLPPSQWGDHFLSLTIKDLDLDVLAKDIEILKPKVRGMLILSSENNNEAMKKKILLIQFLVSLGLSYYFENEIEEIMKLAFEKIEDLIADENDLYTISIVFRVFRTYGYNLSSDVFNRFKGDDGKFKNYLIDDVKGMLSFYEASHFRKTTDYIMDEALSFTINHLELQALGSIATPPHITRLIQNSLHIPQHRKSEALVAREYISFYEQEENHEDTLLNLAKLNFKFLQLNYFQELKTITMWWRELDNISNLPPNFRERTIENWFLISMLLFEPQFSLGRIMSTKLLLTITILDDACDTFGSISEVASLVDCLERWDPCYMENLQGHMKSVFKFVMYVFKELEDILRSQGRLFVLEKMIEEVKIFARANLEHTKWARGSEEPSFDMYMENSGDAIATNVSIACAIMGLGEAGGKEAFEWLRSRPKLVSALGAKTRLMDDITDFEEDMSKGYTANALNYYMKEYGVTKEEASGEFEKMIGDINNCKRGVLKGNEHATPSSYV